MNLDQEIIKHAKVIWNYHQMNHTLEKSDLILCMGSHDLRVAERAAQLLLEGYSNRILFSGGLGRLTSGIWDVPEAEKFADVAAKMGVTKEHILIENKSTNTGENIKYSYELLTQKNIEVSSIILVQKPYMERRAYATFAKQWPGKEVKFTVTSPRIEFDDYPNKEITIEEVINIMIGDLQRILIYPEKGFQIEQEVPKQVINSYKFLINKGFNKHLISPE